MKPSRLRGSFLLCALLSLASGSGRVGAQEVTRVHLRLTAADACATASALIARVEGRSTRIAFVADEATRPELVVALRPQGQRVAANLTVVWPDARRSERQVTDTSCEQTLDALALLIALTLDPSAPASGDAALRAEPASGVSVSEAPSAPSAADSAPVTDAAGSPAASSAASVEPGPAAASAPTQPAVRPASEANSPRDASAAGAELRLDHVAVGLGAYLRTGAAPVLMPGLAVQVRVAFAFAGPWAPALQLSAAHVASPTLSEPGGLAKFRLDVAQLDACPLGLAFGPIFARACATGALGSHEARGTRTFDPARRTRLWASLGAALLAELPLTSAFDLQLRAGLGLPLHRDRFAFLPTSFYRVALLGLCIGLSMEVRFP